MDSKNTKPARKLDPFEGIATNELMLRSRVYNEATDTYEYDCPYCDKTFDSADDFYCHLEGGEFAK